MARDSFINEMRSGVTATSIISILGIDPYGSTALDAYNFIKGYSSPKEMNDVMLAGLLYENIALNFYEFGDPWRNVESFLPNDVELYRQPSEWPTINKSHKGAYRLSESSFFNKEINLKELFKNLDVKLPEGFKYPDIITRDTLTWCLCHPDGLEVNKSNTVIDSAVEVKSMRSIEDLMNRGEVYPHWFVQQQWQMMCIGTSINKLLAIDRETSEIYLLPPTRADELTQLKLFALAYIFWHHHIVGNREPEIIKHSLELPPLESEELIEDPELRAKALTIVKNNQAIKTLEDETDRLKTQVELEVDSKKAFWNFGNVIANRIVVPGSKKFDKVARARVEAELKHPTDNLLSKGDDYIRTSYKLAK